MEEIRICYQRINLLRFISHLDTLRLFQRAFTRANIPIQYSEGFNPHPRISMGDPVSLGIESREEYMDIKLSSPMDGESICKALNEHLPNDIRIIGFTDKNLNKSIQSLIANCDYIFVLEIEESKFEIIKENASLFLDEKEIFIKRKRKRKGKKIEIEENIRPLINRINSLEFENGFMNMYANLSCGLDAHLKPDLFFEAFMKFCKLEYDKNALDIIKDRVFTVDNDEGLL